MAVHIHSFEGVGDYDIAGANPALLEPVLSDPALHGTRGNASRLYKLGLR